MISPTSIAANREMTESGRKISHAQMILNGMRRMPNNEGNFELIAKYTPLEDRQVWKRLSEMEADGLIYKTSRTSKLKSKSQGVIWKLTEQPKPAVQTSLFN